MGTVKTIRKKNLTLNTNMNILYVPTKDPRLRNGGNEQRTNLLWESLKRYGRVYTIVFDAYLTTNEEMIAGEHPIYKYPPSFKNNLWNCVNNNIDKLSLFSIFRRYSTYCPNPKLVFRDIQFDVVISRYIFPVCCYDYWKIAPLVIDIDDHPLQVFWTIHKHNMRPCMRLIGEIVTKWQFNYLINKTIGGWISNEEQVKLLGNNYYFLPNIPNVPSREYDAEYAKRKDLFTVGTMVYPPNCIGVSRFLKEVWPYFHEKHPNVKYFIIGKEAPEEAQQFWRSFEGVEYLGFVDNLEGVYQRSLAAVIPIYMGGGTCIKTLEAMAFSRMCISTPFGARGLPDSVIRDERGVIIFDDKEDFVKAYERICDEEYRKSKEQLGRETIQNTYSQQNFDAAVDKVMKKIAYHGH